MNKKSKLISEDNEWTFEKLNIAMKAIEPIAFDELKLDIYPNQIEIITSSQMLDAYSSYGLPMMYDHWSFGKHFLQQEQSYRKGHSGLAYEVVVNLNPCISYLMEDNSMVMMTLVIAHAAFGHNHVFKNNYLFKQWTDAESMLDYLAFAKKYISKCEEQHGAKAVEDTLNACHAIMDYGVDRYKRPSKLSKEKELEKQKEREHYVQSQANELWSFFQQKSAKKEDNKPDVFPVEPQENLMYFLEKHSPILESWQREIVRIVRKISQYLAPQGMTRTLNEGWASFTHHYIMNRLWEKDQITEGQFLEFLHSHSSVVMQLPFDHKYYNGINPYALGFDIFTDIRRICTEPTDEDKEYFPDLIGQNWVDVCLDAVANYRDESLIAQFLSPHLIRKWGFFEITNNETDKHVTISGIQDKRSYNDVRTTLSRQYSISNHHPDIQIINANLKGNRTLNLKYNSHNGARLSSEKSKVLEYIKYLWGYEVTIE